jgi:hypothetical protein
MRRGIILAGAMATAVFAASPSEAQLTDQHFRGGRTSDLAALCAASAQDPIGQVALGYCQGFVIGVGQYHRSLTAEGGAQRPIFCLPNPSPTFDQARAAFVAWARDNPQYGPEPAIDGLMRFAAEAYPCPTAPVPRPRR